MFGTRGISLSLSGACASGAHAIGWGWMLISSGMYDICVTGGTQELCWQSMAAFDGLRVFSMKLDNPTGAVRPFDRDRDGLVPGGGAATLILEEYEYAKRRGANILAEVVSYAFSSDGDHMTTGDGKGAARCMQQALDTAGIKPHEIDYINAHATGTDASEALYRILMMREDFIAPNRNYENQDPKLPKLNIVAKPVTGVKLKHVLSNSFGFGGTNACLVVKAV